MRREQQDGQSSVFYELSSLVLSILRSPPPPSFPFSDHASRRPVPTPLTPAGFASLLLGVSLALMLCGSVTFFIGFLMMPWVVGSVVFFYFAAVVSMIGRSVFYCAATPPVLSKLGN